ncbi:MAG: hypothetical protein OXS29_18270 [bacterium]|nr:hypothetical protein [bacterium]MDE0289604.1 hypothetical protein [bacterium]MDE0440446.1 hypothetical protein [bacterium]
MQVAAVQTGPVDERPASAVRRAFRQLGDLSPDLVVFPELFSLPFWCVGHTRPDFFAWAEDLEGETLTAAREEVRERGCHAVVPFFERGPLPGEYFNSAAVLGPDGSIIRGLLPGGAEAPVYRKNAISSYNWGGSVNDEKYYFRVGPGYPVFPTGVGKLGVLICYDRWFSEAWRLLALAGAEVICIPNASSGAVSELFIPSIRTWSAQNVVFSVAVNRAGSETVNEVTTAFYGLSCLTSPRGKLLDAAPEGEPGVASAVLDLEEIAEARMDQTMYRDRRPELYPPLTWS